MLPDRNAGARIGDPNTGWRLGGKRQVRARSNVHRARLLRLLGYAPVTGITAPRSWRATLMACAMLGLRNWIGAALSVLADHHQ